MAITYNWVISQLDTAPSDDGLTNVVKTIHWRYQATDGTHLRDIYGSVGLSAPAVEDFVPYDELTEAKVIEWLEDNLNIEEMKTNLDNQIEQLIHPPIVNLPLPWNVAVSETPAE